MTPTIRNRFFVVSQEGDALPAGWTTEDRARRHADAIGGHVAMLFILPPVPKKPYRMTVTSVSTPSNWAPRPR